MGSQLLIHMAIQKAKAGGGGGGGGGKKREHKTYEVRVYLLMSSYSGELELLTTINYRCKDVFTDHGRAISLAKTTIEEYVRNIGMFGITIEDPEDAFSYYPPQRIGKVEYNVVDKD